MIKCSALLAARQKKRKDNEEKLGIWRGTKIKFSSFLVVKFFDDN